MINDLLSTCGMARQVIVSIVETDRRLKAAISSVEFQLNILESIARRFPVEEELNSTLVMFLASIDDKVRRIAKSVGIDDISCLDDDNPKCKNRPRSGFKAISLGLSEAFMSFIGRGAAEKLETVVGLEGDIKSMISIISLELTRQVSTSLSGPEFQIRRAIRSPSARAFWLQIFGTEMFTTFDTFRYTLKTHVFDKCDIPDFIVNKVSENIARGRNLVSAKTFSDFAGDSKTPILELLMEAATKLQKSLSLVGLENRLTVAAVGEDLGILCLASADGKIFMYNTREKTSKCLLSPGGIPKCLCVNQDMKLLCVGTDHDEIIIIEVENILHSSTEVINGKIVDIASRCDMCAALVEQSGSCNVKIYNINTLGFVLILKFDTWCSFDSKFCSFYDNILQVWSPSSIIRIDASNKIQKLDKNRTSLDWRLKSGINNTSTYKHTYPSSTGTSGTFKECSLYINNHYKNTKSVIDFNDILRNSSEFGVSCSLNITCVSILKDDWVAVIGTDDCDGDFMYHLVLVNMLTKRKFKIATFLDNEVNIVDINMIDNRNTIPQNIDIVLVWTTFDVTIQNVIIDNSNKVTSSTYTRIPNIVMRSESVLNRMPREWNTVGIDTSVLKSDILYTSYGFRKTEKWGIIVPLYKKPDLTCREVEMKIVCHGAHKALGGWIVGTVSDRGACVVQLMNSGGELYGQEYKQPGLPTRVLPLDIDHIVIQTKHDDVVESSVYSTDSSSPKTTFKNKEIVCTSSDTMEIVIRDKTTSCIQYINSSYNLGIDILPTTFGTSTLRTSGCFLGDKYILIADDSVFRVYSLGSLGIINKFAVDDPVLDIRSVSPMTTKFIASTKSGQTKVYEVLDEGNSLNHIVSFVTHVSNKVSAVVSGRNLVVSGERGDIIWIETERCLPYMYTGTVTSIL
jgi:hypothetical protein